MVHWVLCKVQCTFSLFHDKALHVSMIYIVYEALHVSMVYIVYDILTTLS